jgi:hypothetical protein
MLGKLKIANFSLKGKGPLNLRNISRTLLKANLKIVTPFREKRSFQFEEEKSSIEGGAFFPLVMT